MTNYSYTPDQGGRTWLETYVTALLFTDNDNFRVGGAPNAFAKIRSFDWKSM